jgi:hypothetical protein
MTLSWDTPSFLSFGAMVALAVDTRFCKAEVALPYGVDFFDDHRLRRLSLLWEIDGTLHADPSPALLPVTRNQLHRMLQQLMF